MKLKIEQKLSMTSKICVAFLIAVVFSFSCIFSSVSANVSSLNDVRTSQSHGKVRVVFDLDSLFKYNVQVSSSGDQITIDFTDVVNRSGKDILNLKDSLVGGVKITTIRDNVVRVVISVREKDCSYNAFALRGPHRLVIDVYRAIEMKTEKEIDKNVKYISFVRKNAKENFDAHIIEIAPGSGYTLKPILGKDKVKGLETLSDMAKRTDHLAMINTSYFSGDGVLLGLFVKDREIISSQNIKRAAFGITADNKVIIDQVSYSGVLELENGKKFPISSINGTRGENELVLFNHYFSDSTKTNNYGIERTIVGGEVVKADNKNNSVLDKEIFVLSGHGKAAEFLKNLKVGDNVYVEETLGTNFDQTIDAIGAGPMLVKDGEVFLATKVEKFSSDVAGGRAPRSALGIDKTGKIYLVVIDGRSQESSGMTLLELALFMKELGAFEALNLDGGGSSEMIIKGEIINKPSDGQERKIAGAVGVVKTNP